MFTFLTVQFYVAGPSDPFIACNHGMQFVLHAISPFGSVYCTQQTGGLTRGMTLRAIHAEAATSPGDAEVQRVVNPAPQHCVQYANVRFRTDGPSGPHWALRRIEAHVKLRVLALQVQRTAEVRTGLPWARIAHLLGTLKAVRYVAEGRTIVQRTKIAGELGDLLKKLGIPIPKQLLAVTEAADTPAAA